MTGYNNAIFASTVVHGTELRFSLLLYKVPVFASNRLYTKLGDKKGAKNRLNNTNVYRIAAPIEQNHRSALKIIFLNSCNELLISVSSFLFVNYDEPVCD